MENKKDITFFDLETRLENEMKTIDEDYSELKTSNPDGYKDEAISEIIDGIVPIYNYDLLTVAMSDLWLGTKDTEQDNKNAFDCLREAIFNKLYEKAIKIINK